MRTFLAGVALIFAPPAIAQIHSGRTEAAATLERTMITEPASDIDSEANPRQVVRSFPTERADPTVSGPNLSNAPNRDASASVTIVSPDTLE